jgi:SAM-dependent methyltransferase
LEHHSDITVDHVTLVDPLIQQYNKLEGCSYKVENDGIEGQKCWDSMTYDSRSNMHEGKTCATPAILKVKDKTYPTTAINSSVEAFAKHYMGNDVLLSQALNYVPTNMDIKLFDTVIVMNVLVYSRNAFEFLETIYRFLKPGGLLLIHDRYFDNYVHSSKCKMAGFLTHMIQVKSDVLNYFISDDFFDHQPYYNTTQNSHQKRRNREWCPYHDDEKGFFVAITKK